MKFTPIAFLLLLFFTAANRPGATVNAVTGIDTIPSMLKGEFVDDYDIRYTLNDTMFTLQPNARYHILKWNTKEQYFVARNDMANPSEKGLYTRVDYIFFNGMDPWLWGFCLTAYDAKTPAQAEEKAAADRQNPKKGCNGYPFSRMKRQ